jgi:hypothetical protein
MECKWHEEGRKDLKVQNGSRGKNGTGGEKKKKKSQQGK